MADPKTAKKVFSFSLLSRVFQFAAPYKNKFYWSIFLAVLLAVFSPIRPWLIQRTINDGLQPDPEFWFLKGASGVIIGVTIIQLSLLIIETIARFFFTFLTASIGQNVVNDMRIKTYNKITQHWMSLNIYEILSVIFN